MREPCYVAASRTGDLARRVKVLHEALASCALCPRRCRVNRWEDERGFCRTGRSAVVASYGPHFGEEDPLVGRGGSGTIFFTHCNLRCCFCQNVDISHEGAGRPVDAETLAGMMMALQERGCHNVNLVSPSHVIAQIVEALALAVDAGLRLPLVYNTGGYDSLEGLRRLDGLVDIYMPDAKFASPDVAGDLADAEDYPETMRAALLEMHRQVGDLCLNAEGEAIRGLLVRHLVLPGDLAGTEATLSWIASRVSPNTYVNIMDQYRPHGTISMYDVLNRRIRPEEMRAAFRIARRAGLHRFDTRRLPSHFSC